MACRGPATLCPTLRAEAPGGDRVPTRGLAARHPGLLLVERGAESLTPTELRVARLAAGARTNREIAQGLYVTVKTVEGHLARVYTKLGIAGRAQLGAALDEEKARVPSR